MFYEAPGFLLLARGDDDSPAGCVGLRTVADGVGEVRRLFVDPTHRTGGLGRAVVRELISHAQARGIRRLVLNTLPTMAHAVEMYRSIGFTPTAPYLENPIEGVLFFELALCAS